MKGRRGILNDEFRILNFEGWNVLLKCPLQSSIAPQATVRIFDYSAMSTTTTYQHTGTEAPPETIRRAKELVAEYPSCFWFWKERPVIQFEEDVRLVAQRLREYGDKETWEAAKELLACL